MPVTPPRDPTIVDQLVASEGRASIEIASPLTFANPEDAAALIADALSAPGSIGDETPGPAAFTEVQIGGGAVIAKVLTASAILSFGFLGDGVKASQTISLPGAIQGDAVFPGYDADITENVPVMACLANDVITVTVTGNGTTVLGTFRAVIMQF